MKIEFTKQFSEALRVMNETTKNVFITGKAGTGKSTLLQYFRNNTKKKAVMLAPTGVAALNVHGQTIHSFFKFKPGITLNKIKKTGKNEKNGMYKKIDAIVIDEISMVRADLLDCVDKFLRLNGKNKSMPFGGIQMIFIGDLYQLPPVVTGAEREIFRTLYKSQYFFDAHVFESLDMEFIELEKIYRQKDQGFVELLNAIRNNSATEEHLGVINTRLDPEFDAKDRKFYITLTTTNQLAQEINYLELAKLKQKEYIYPAQVLGNFDISMLPTALDLAVKTGSQIMLLNNDSAGRWVNGSIGKIVDIEVTEENAAHSAGSGSMTSSGQSAAGEGEYADENKEDVLIVELTDGEIVEVSPFTWEMFAFSYDEKKKSLVTDTVGTFRQYPLMLAWAVTIHKSQGKTFDNVIIDIGRGTFAHGQLYVALSRCTSLEGMVLRKPIKKQHIFMDWRVVKFLTKYQYAISDAAIPLNKKIDMIRDAIDFGNALEIVYLKANDMKSKRVIRPGFVGEMEFKGRVYLGVNAYDQLRQAERVFRVDRMLEIKVV